jgi:hypothetical protein
MFNFSARTNTRLDQALAAFEAGFTTKAAQKQAMADLNSAWSEINGAHHTWAIAKADAEFAGTDWDNAADETYRARYDAIQSAHDLPFDLHQVRGKHMGQMCDIDAVEATKTLMLQREAFKAAEIVKVERPAAVEKAERVRETILELMARRQTQYVEAVALGELFGGLPVSVSAHWVTNQFGTQFLRRFYFLQGKLTPLNIIICAAEELERRADK